MEYYQHQLTEVIQYPELKPVVFNMFTELGNTVLCFLLMEQALVWPFIVKCFF